jgi:hypothetical protein
VNKVRCLKNLSRKLNPEIIISALIPKNWTSNCFSGKILIDNGVITGYLFTGPTSRWVTGAKSGRFLSNPRGNLGHRKGEK